MIMAHQHVWVSGMMYVDPEDVAEVARMRAAAEESLPECEECGEEFDLEAETHMTEMQWAAG